MSLAALSAGLPFFESGVLFKIPIGGGIPIQTFGVIVAAGVLIGAYLLRRYAEWHGVPDEHIRHLTGWITITGFIGAHVFDVLAYQFHELEQDPLLLFKIWAGISSYGGFIGGAGGFAFYVWWKRLDPRLMADIGVIGLLPAFSIGRIGCSVVSDHIGAAVGNPDAWYASLAMDYPRFGDAVLHNSGIAHLAMTYPGTSEYIRAWNLGLIELLYLIPVNLVLLWIAFRPSKRMPAGFIAALAGILYAPVRFFLDYLRPETSDPRYFSLTFAQWSSIAFFGAAVYFASRLLKNGKAAEPVTRTSGEMQDQLKTILKDTDAEAKATKGDGKKAKVDEVKLPAAKATEVKKEAAKTEPEANEPEAKKAEDKDDAYGEQKRLKEAKDEAEAQERRKKQDEEWAAKVAAKAEADAAAKAEAAAKAAAKGSIDEKSAETEDDEALDHPAPAALGDDKKSGATKKKPKKK